MEPTGSICKNTQYNSINQGFLEVIGVCFRIPPPPRNSKHTRTPHESAAFVLRGPRTFYSFFCSFLEVYASKGQKQQNKTMTEREFEKMVREHRGEIYTVCYMFSTDKEEVADLFQEILINLWKGSGTFRGESGLGTWIWKVSLNTCISIDRSRRRRPHTEPLSMDIDLFEDKDESAKQIGALRNRISKLGTFDRAIVLLWLENLSYEEIGQIVGISTKNVSVRLVRIKEQLKKMK